MSRTFSFDESVFRTLGAEIGEAETLEVLEAFLADTANKLTKLDAGGEMLPLIKREAHSIKSSAATFGFDDLSGLARDIEFGAETMDLAKLQESICGLRQAFEMTKRFAQAKLLKSGTEMAT
jgi:HPt (histidine-containing phosphotransfer) domain-containing protein